MKKKTLLFLLSVFALIFFHAKFYTLFDDYIVDKFLSGLKGDWLYWPICLLSVASVVQLLAMYRDRDKINDAVFMGSSILLLVYLYQRFFSNRYTFHFSSYDAKISFTDYFLIPLLGMIILGIADRTRRKVKPEMSRNPFLVDSPLSESSLDNFNRKKYAQTLADKIQSATPAEFTGALAIGILGKWGSGKTSFMNMIRENIEQKGRIIIDFNPWRSSSPQMIIESFFEVLTTELATYDRSLSRDMGKYADSLTSLDDSWVSKSIKQTVEYFTGPSTVGVDYDEINEALGRINKQIIVFIDDLDRLDSKEIVQVLRIIRNTGNFQNLVYIVGYDRSYVSLALQDINSHKAHGYLEKIFQFEFALPDAEPLTLRRNIRQLLKSAIPNQDLHDFIDAAIDYTSSSGECFTDAMIRTQREVVRLCNAFLFESNGQLREINIPDFYLLELLKIRYPKFYEGLVRYKDHLFIAEAGKMRLRLSSEIGLTQDSFSFISRAISGAPKPETTSSETFLDQYMLSFKEDILDEFSKRIIVDLIEALLYQKELKNDSTSGDYKGFVNQYNFGRYFMTTEASAGPSFAEFEDARLSDFPDYLQKVTDWSADPNQLAELERRLDAVEDFTNLREWENHLKILIEIERQKMIKRGAYGLKYAQLVNVLRFPVKNAPVRFFDSIEDYLDYVRHLFNNAPDPYVFEAHLLMAVLVSKDEIGLSNVEIQDQLFEYLKQYAEHHPEITSDFRQLHPAVVEKDQDRYDQYPIQQRAQMLFKEHFKKYLKACELSGFIKKHFDPHGDYYMFDSTWVAEIFETHENFMEYTRTASNIDRQSGCYKEFGAFAEAVEKSSHPAIEFSFEHLKKEN